MCPYKTNYNFLEKERKSTLYILKGFKKLVISFLNSKNTLNLISLSLFLKYKKGYNCKLTKIKNKNPTQRLKKKKKTTFKLTIKNLPTVPIQKKKKKSLMQKPITIYNILEKKSLILFVPLLPFPTLWNT